MYDIASQSEHKVHTTLIIMEEITPHHAISDLINLIKLNQEHSTSSNSLDISRFIILQYSNHMPLITALLLINFS